MYVSRLIVKGYMSLGWGNCLGGGGGGLSWLLVLISYAIPET